MSTRVPSTPRTKADQVMLMSRDAVIAEIKLLATPLDFDDLIARGILRKAGGNWYWLLVPPREWPEGFGRRIAAGASSSKGMKVRFWSAKKGREAGAPT